MRSCIVVLLVLSVPVYAGPIDTVSVPQGDVAVLSVPAALVGPIHTKEPVQRDIGIALVGKVGTPTRVLVAADLEAYPRTTRVAVSIGDTTIRFVVRILVRRFPESSIAQRSSLGRKPESALDRANDARFISALSAVDSMSRFAGVCDSPLADMRASSLFGKTRHYADRSVRHSGVDLEASEGTAVFSVAPGVVVWGEATPLYANGCTVVIDHGGGVRSFYCHLSNVVRRTGKTVELREHVGDSGNTGHSMGPHLHLSLKVGSARIDPLRFIGLFHPND